MPHSTAQTLCTVNTHKHIQTHTNTHKHTHKHAKTRKNTQTHTNTHRNTHRNTHTQTHTQTHTALNKSSAAQLNVARDCACSPHAHVCLRRHVRSHVCRASAPTGGLLCPIFPCSFRRYVDEHGSYSVFTPAEGAR